MEATATMRRRRRRRAYAVGGRSLIMPTVMDTIEPQMKGSATRRLTLKWLHDGSSSVKSRGKKKTMVYVPMHIAKYCHAARKGW